MSPINFLSIWGFLWLPANRPAKERSRIQQTTSSKVRLWGRKIQTSFSSLRPWFAPYLPSPLHTIMIIKWVITAWHSFAQATITIHSIYSLMTLCQSLSWTYNYVCVNIWSNLTILRDRSEPFPLFPVLSLAKQVWNWNQVWLQSPG